MSIALTLNEALVQEALDLSQQNDLNFLIETALREYIQRHKRLKIIELFGTIDYDPSYDYKQQRQSLWVWLLILPYGL